MAEVYHDSRLFDETHLVLKLNFKIYEHKTRFHLNSTIYEEEEKGDGDIEDEEETDVKNE